EQLQARWVVDASGIAALLSRQEGWWRPNRAHPTTAVWARWTGVKDWDGLELAEKFPDWAMACHGIRATATNHFTGDGWWAWCIPLKGGDVSVGVVFNQRRVQWPEGGPLGERLKNFLMQHRAGGGKTQSRLRAQLQPVVYRSLPGQVRVFGRIRPAASRLPAGPWLVLPRGGFAAIQTREDGSVRAGLHVVALDAVLHPDAV